MRWALVPLTNEGWPAVPPFGTEVERRASALLAVAKAAVLLDGLEDEQLLTALDALRAVWPEWDAKE